MESLNKSLNDSPKFSGQKDLKILTVKTNLALNDIRDVDKKQFDQYYRAKVIKNEAAEINVKEAKIIKNKHAQNNIALSKANKANTTTLTEKQDNNKINQKLYP